MSADACCPPAPLAEAFIPDEDELVVERAVLPVCELIPDEPVAEEPMPDEVSDFVDFEPLLMLLSLP